MIWPFHDKEGTNYWLRAFAWYAVAEAGLQLIFFFIFNTFGNFGGSYLEYHLVMWIFHCLLIWPIWWVAWLVHKQKIVFQLLINVVFFFIYSYYWFGPVQDVIAYLYNNLLDFTHPGNNQGGPTIDSERSYSILNYQLLKHAFRLSWFYLANYFYNYQLEEKKMLQLAVSNKELQLKLLKWHLNPSFYFKTIKHLQQSAAVQPANATEPILQLAKVMEYVIYEAREPEIEMKKDIQFLDNYIQLINHQPDNKIQINLEYEGQYEKLKIVPLLMAGLIDNIMASGKNAESNQCNIRMQFSGNKMHFSATPIVENPIDPLLLEELYPGKFSTDYSSGNTFNLHIYLNEA